MKLTQDNQETTKEEKRKYRIQQVKEYNKKYQKRITLHFGIKNQREKEAYEYAKQQPSSAGYIKNLICEDMMKNKKQ